MRKYNYMASAFFALIGGYILYETSTYSIGKGAQNNPAMWPRYLAIALIALSILLVLETLFQKKTEKTETAAGEETGIDWKSPGMKKAYIALCIMVGFIIVMNILGMLVGLLLMVPAIMALMGCRSKKMLIIMPVCVVVFIYVFFVQIMTITLPSGIFF